jgi:hypothetical protein
VTAPLYSDVAARIRALLDDQITPGGATFTDAYCQPYVDMAQDTLVTYLISNSVELLKFRTETPITVPAGTLILDYPGYPTSLTSANVALLLPNDLVEPDQLFEAKVGGANEDFIQMSGPGPIPRIAQSDTLGYWSWYDGRLHLLGSTVDRDIRLVYWSSLPKVDLNGPIKVVALCNALATLAASLAARSRGQHDIADRYATFDRQTGVIGGQAGFEIQHIINAETKAGQSEPVRRQPMLGRNRYDAASAWMRAKP